MRTTFMISTQTEPPDIDIQLLYIQCSVNIIAVLYKASSGANFKNICDIFFHDSGFQVSQISSALNVLGFINTTKVS